MAARRPAASRRDAASAELVEHHDRRRRPRADLELVSERIMPSESTPRSLAVPSLRPVGHHAPRACHGDGLPGGHIRRAAHDRGRPVAGSPRSTVHTFSRSASGWCSALSTLPTTKCSADGTPWWWIASTLVPVIVRRSSIAATSRPGRSTRAATRSGTLTRTAPGSAGRSRSTGAGPGCRA